MEITTQEPVKDEKTVGEKMAEIFGHQHRDSVRFKLGTRPIDLDTVAYPDGDQVGIVIDGVEVVVLPSDIVEHHYRTALETARRIGMREV